MREWTNVYNGGQHIEFDLPIQNMYDSKEMSCVNATSTCTDNCTQGSKKCSKALHKKNGNEN